MTLAFSVGIRQTEVNSKGLSYIVMESLISLAVTIREIS